MMAELLKETSKKQRRSRQQGYFRKKLMPGRGLPRKDSATVELTSSDRAEELDSVLKQANYESVSCENGEKTKTEGPKELERHLSLFDLIAIGIGGTIGSGFFVLIGLVAHSYAGPAAIFSWLLSGIAACVSGTCYAELSARIPLSGSAYAYTYVAMGELPALLTAACLSLEYAVASAAVARSWGDKCVVFLEQELPNSEWVHTYLDFRDRSSFSPLSFVISSGSIILLLAGVRESKRATNSFTIIKVTVVAFMLLLGAYNVQPANWKPFFPKEFGVSGILRGASGTFFGYLGYDQVCCIAGEVKDPKKNLPRAIMGVLLGVTLLYMAGTLVLVGMLPYTEVSSVSGYPSAFYEKGFGFAARITAVGELVTLPLVFFVTVMMQPRLQYAMAVDGLLPPMFAEVDDSGNLFKGTVVAGSIFIIVSTFIPFEHLNDMISCAVLLALSMTDTSVILLWRESQEHHYLAEKLVFTYHVCCFVTSLIVTKYLESWVGTTLALLACAGMVYSVLGLYRWCPELDIFGGHHEHYHQAELLVDEKGFFRTPMVPLWPCIGIFINWYLIAQVEANGLISLFCFFGVVLLYYFLYANHNSVVGNMIGWSPALTGSGMTVPDTVWEQSETTKLTSSLR